ncbi:MULTISPECIES: hypothetical protein [Gimesia]|uniref:Uncharacterized protein n=1 Tax=Gimesia chilikensis TaxID=2605989 RepID=A0A517PUR2_9PLAN|nr:hypothetical protein [Gimesia chilikensis]MBN70862.1 hypothetical protein [Gimesia sp.]QDT23109.1 hypothetical protein HG66A1_49230 [Gimesia chilikensis]
MAIIFDLYVECHTPEELGEIKSHFEGLTFELQTGKTTHWQFSPEDIEGVYACSLWSRQLSDCAVRTVTDAIECTEAGVRLYRHLQQGPDFQFARVAWEATFIGGWELEDWLEPLGDPGESRLGLECVFTEARYEQLGRPKYCKAFRPGYVWTGYRGEVYRPLWSSDQKELTDLYREYFPHAKDLK